jgi:MFS family permease
VVGCGLVITCVGLGTTLSLSVFLQPISQAMGWSRTGISLAALVSFLAMGVGSFVWGALSDRFGARVVVLAGGLLLGLGLVLASQARSLLAFQLLFGVIVGAAAGSFYAPLTATTTRWFTRHRTLAVALVSAGIGLGSMTIAPLARWLITTWDWRTAMLVIPRRRPVHRDGPAGRRVHRRGGAALAAARRHRADAPGVLRRALRPHLSHGHQRHRSRRLAHGGHDGPQRGGVRVAHRARRVRARG